MAHVVVMANQKGGVGKTTTTYHFADAARRNGLKVLAIDIDPQGSLTSSLSREYLPPDTIGLADVLSARTNEQLADVIVPTVWDGVDLAPTTGENLSFVRDELIATRMGRESKLKLAIQSLDEGAYDLVLIDCPPSIDQLTSNALVAADAVVIVTHASLYSMNGIAHLIDNVELVNQFYNPALRIAGIVLNQFERQLNAPVARKMELSEAIESHGLVIYEPVIPKRTIISETVENGESLSDYGNEVAQQLAKNFDLYISKVMGEAKS